MELLRFLLLCGSAGFLACAAGLVGYDIYLVFELDRMLRRSPNAAVPPEAGETPSTPALPRLRRPIRVSDAPQKVVPLTLMAAEARERRFAGQSFLASAGRAVRED